MKIWIQKIHKERGFTLTELLLTIGLIALVTSASLISFLQFRNQIETDVLVDEVLTTINFARNQAAAGKDPGNFGVYFEMDAFTMFEGSSYSPSDPNNVRTEVTGNTYLSITCTPTQNDTVVFSKILGESDNDCDVSIMKTSSATPAAVIEVRKLGTIRVIRYF